MVLAMATGPVDTVLTFEECFAMVGMASQKMLQFYKKGDDAAVLMYQHFINTWSSKDWLKADKEEEEEEGKDNAEKTDGKAAEEKEDGTESPLLFPSVDLDDECEDSKQRSTEALGKMLPAERKLADEQYRQELQKSKKNDLLTNLQALEALEAMQPAS